MLSASSPAVRRFLQAASLSLAVVSPGMAQKSFLVPIEKDIVERVFYTGRLNRYWQAGTSGILGMSGYTRTRNGGTIRSVTVCLYNESAFDRNFIAQVTVNQGGTRVHSIRFQRRFPPSRFDCHKLTEFNAVVGPGGFVVSVFYSDREADNFFLGLGSTTEGETFDVEIGSARPPFATGEQGPIQIRGIGIKYEIERNEAPPPAGHSLGDSNALIVPGTADQGETFVAVRNISNSAMNLELQYFGSKVTDTPTQVEPIDLAPNETHTAAIEPGAGLVLIAGADPEMLVGDYIRVDRANAFASGGRLVKPADLCARQEIRFLDFGSSTLLHVLVDRPQSASEPAFSYTIYDESGMVVDQGDYVTDDHLNLVQLSDWTAVRFGTVVLDFTASEGGWAAANYSAFGLFSVELPSQCRD